MSTADDRERPTSGQFLYQPLPSGGYFRLLHLQAGTGPLVCSLTCQKIEDCIETYDALSYAWDDTTNATSESLQCDDCILITPATVVAALYVARDIVRTTTIWVDKICINQDDQDERAQQVMVMGSIYSNANQTLIWLGPDLHREARECFDLIQATNSTLTKLIKEFGDINSIPNAAISQGSVCNIKDKWFPVERMMHLKWFSRVWVLNEVGHARSALIMYGHSIMRWSELVELMLLAASRPDMATFTGNIKSGTIWETFESVWRPFGGKVHWKNELPFTRTSNQQPSDEGSLITILNDLRIYDATDQRDRVYAFLNHPYALKKNRITGKESFITTANYHLPVDEVYKEVAMQLLHTDQHAWTVLSCVDHAGSVSNDSHSFPSWIPRWDESYRVYWLGYPEMWYSAGGRKQNFTFEICSAAQQAFLVLKGIHVGTIDWISEGFTKESITADQQRKSRPLQQVWQNISKEPGSTAYGNSSKDCLHAFHLLLAAGRAADEGPAEDDSDWHQIIFDQYEHDLTQKAQTSHKERDNNVDNTSSETTQDNIEQAKDLDFHVSTYYSNQRRALTGRKIFRTSQGHYGIGHQCSKKGDTCVVFPGAGVPFVLRPVLPQTPLQIAAALLEGRDMSNMNRYRLIGECYIQGLMRGQAVHLAQKSVANGYTEIQMIIE